MYRKTKLNMISSLNQKIKNMDFQYLFAPTHKGVSFENQAPFRDWGHLIFNLNIPSISFDSINFRSMHFQLVDCYSGGEDV